ncbi:MAG: helix-hairpin-helix domain-containing protein [Myxococcota bacterium]
MDADISAALAPEALAPPIARDLGLSEAAVIGVLRLLAAGDQPAFLARFRPERAGSLALRDLERVQARAAHAVAFEFKRAQLRQELIAKDRLDDELADLLARAQHPVDLDDLRSVLRKRKRGAAGKARARGLGVLAGHLWASGSDGRLRGAEPGAPDADPLALAHEYPGRAPTPRRKGRGKSKGSPDDESSVDEGAAAADPSDGDASVTAADDSTADDSAADGSATVADPPEHHAAAESSVDHPPTPGLAESSSDTELDSAGPATEATGEATDDSMSEGAADASSGDAASLEFSTDASSDAPTDASPDISTDTPSDAASDASSDASPDISTDTPSDAASDAPTDAPTDASPDAASDEPSDPSPDAPTGDATDDASAASAPLLPSPERDLASARLIVADDAFAVPIMQRRLRDLVLDTGRLRATVVPGKKDKGGRFAKLAERVEPIAKATPTHILGLLRGEREGVLQVSIEIEPEAFDAVCDELLGIDASRPCGAQLRQALHEGWLGPLGAIVRQSVRKRLKQWADRQATGEFCEAYRPLLLAPALGPRTVMAIDPGFAPGCKVAVLSHDGEVLARETVFPLQPKLQAPQAKARLVELATAHAVEAVVVGNGNGGRDVERLAREAVRETEGLEAIVVSGDVDTAGLYAQSRLAKQALPNDDASMRRAIALGRRLQDPLTELAKLDPRKLPLGQYQHEVDQEELRAALEQVLVSCINEVGVPLNRSTADELARVAGFSHALAKAVVAHREQHGPFPSRQALLDVPGVAGKAFEQGAGFLRIDDGDHALDGTAIHPERYGQVVEMARELGVTVGELVGNAELVDKLEAEHHLDKPGASGEPLGKATLAAILEQLRHPGADPRPPFTPIEFDPNLTKFEDLKVGMELPGVVTHLANFGAFVDVGLREEALVHVSELTHGFISSPFEAVHVGQRVRGQVIEISADRKKFSLSLRALQPKPEGGGKDRGPRRDGSAGKGKGRGRKGGGGGRDRDGRGSGKDRGNDRVLGFKLDLSDLAERLGKG